MIRLLFNLALLQWAREYIAARVREVPCDSFISDEPCWVWTKSGDGRYGHAFLLGGRIKAHILSFLAWGGTLKRHQVVDHLCNRTMCCQPAHLRAATQSQNMLRCFDEGRGRSPFLKEAQ